MLRACFVLEIECWLLHSRCGVLGGKAAAQVQWEGGVPRRGYLALNHSRINLLCLKAGKRVLCSFHRNFALQVAPNIPNGI